jgi:exopolyphosphatase/guanosine-5'-triphosphate,3'-diphosphate pyrophosphatase
MGEIIPRWEWRTFDDDLSAIGEQFKKHGSPRSRETDEIYILSTTSDENTKVRFDLMDIKTLKQVNADGLEQWFPTLKTGFPIPEEVVAELYDTWKVQPLTRPPSAYADLPTFLNQVIDAHKHLEQVAVFKARHGFLINECIVEIAHLRFDGTPIQTVAVEHEDPQRVIKTVRQFQLEGLPNTNYIKALKRHKKM